MHKQESPGRSSIRPAVLEGGARVHITLDYGKERHYAIRLAFKMTNSKVEYETLLAKLSVAEALGAVEVEVRTDSQVVINQVLGEFIAKGKKLKKYLQLVWGKHNHF